MSSNIEEAKKIMFCIHSTAACILVVGSSLKLKHLLVLSVEQCSLIGVPEILK